MEDITKTGPQSYNQLQKENDLSSLDKFITTAPKIGHSYNPIDVLPQTQRSSLYTEGAEDFWGRSRFDTKSGVENVEFEGPALGDTRAISQSNIEKVGAGLGKGVSLAGTTFLNSTLGLVYGLGDAIVEGDYSKLWDNQLSDSLKKWDEQMEKILPNYYTQAEQDNSWYQNLGTVNFWADHFLKNMGFTVGATFSGGAWIKGLKAAGLLTSSAATAWTGSLLSAVGEAAIEANNNSDDWESLQVAQAQSAYNDFIKYLETSQSPNIDAETATAKSVYDQQLLDIAERKKQMGLTDFIGNVVWLSLDNFLTFGKLYAQGFGNGKSSVEDMLHKEVRNITGDTVTKGKISRALDMANLTDFAKRTKGKLGNLSFDEISKGRKIAAGLRTGLREGNEEMMQGFMSEFSGNRQIYDNPDSYYAAYFDPMANKQTQDFGTSIVKSFMDTYGNGDKWEEGAIGFLTGMFGTPTFGKGTNSGSSTYLGKGKFIGLTGGIGGELAQRQHDNAVGNSAVAYLNIYMNKLQDNIDSSKKSQAFVNLMNGWAAFGNQQEYKNAEDNETFEALTRFQRMGRLDDFKSWIGTTFDNMSDEEIATVAGINTRDVESSDTSNRSGFRAKDGSLLTNTPEGIAEIRKILKEKQQNLLKQMDDFSISVENVRTHTADILSDSQISELAWLDWKAVRFTDRYNDVVESNRDALVKYSEILQTELDDITIDDNSSEEDKSNKKSLQNSLNLVRTMISSKGDSPALMKAVQKMSKEDLITLFSDNIKASFFSKEATEVQPIIADLYNLINLKHSFNQRYKEFMDSPEKIEENHKKIEEKVSKDVAVEQSQQQLQDKEKEVVSGNLTNVTSQDRNNPVIDKAVQDKKTQDEQEAFRKQVSDSVDSLSESDVKDFLADQIKTNPDLIDSDELQQAAKDFAADNIAPEDLDDFLAQVNGTAESIRINASESVTLPAAELDGITEASNETETPPISTSDEVSQGVSDSIIPIDSYEILTSKIFGFWGYAVDPKNISDAYKDAYETLKKVLYNIHFLVQQNPSITGEDILKVPRSIISFTKKYLTDLENPNYNTEIHTTPENFDALVINYVKAIKANDSKLIFETPVKSISNEELQDSECKEDFNEDSSEEVVASSIPSTSPSSDWLVNTTESDLNLQKKRIGINKPYYESEPDKLSNGETNYTKKIHQVIWEFLEKEGVFARRNMNTITADGFEPTPGKIVKFLVSKELQDKINSIYTEAQNVSSTQLQSSQPIIILFADEAGHILGDLPRLGAGSSNRNYSLAKFLESAINQYKADISSKEITEDYYFDFTTTINNIIPGEIARSSEHNTLVDIFGDAPVTMGVYTRNADGSNVLEAFAGSERINASQIVHYKEYALGKPYAFIQCGYMEYEGSIVPKYLPINIDSPYYDSKALQGTKISNTIDKTLQKLLNLKNVLDENTRSKEALNVRKELENIFRFPMKSIKDKGDGKMYKQSTLYINTQGADIVLSITDPETSSRKEIKVTNSTTLESLRDEFNGMSFRFKKSQLSNARYVAERAEICTANIQKLGLSTFNNGISLNPVVITKEQQPSKQEETQPQIETAASTDTAKLNSFVRALSSTQKSTYNKFKDIIPEYFTSISSKTTFKKVIDKLAGQDSTTKTSEEWKKYLDNALNKNRTTLPVTKVWDKNEELTWLKKVLPQFSNAEHLRIVSFLENGTLWGQFRASDGIICIAENAGRGTVYHEAFHAVVEMALSEKDKNTMFAEAIKKFGEMSKLELEERLAEDFRTYIETSQNPFKAFFQKIKNFINKLKGSTLYLDSLYNRINSGEFASVDYNTMVYNQHVNNLKFNNLSVEDQEYILSRGLTERDYEEMSFAEKEVFKECMM